MSYLHLALLGSPQVRHNDQLLTFSTRKELALLVYLAVEGGVHRRGSLMELLWPDSDATRGRVALRVTLLRLRERLGETIGREEQGHLLITGDLLKFDTAADCDLDVQKISSAWKAAQANPHGLTPGGSEQSRQLLSQLEEASRLARGPFLEGFFLRDATPFDDWMRIQRQVWHVRLRLIFHRLSCLQEEMGSVERARQTISRWLTFDPLDEEAYQRLMSLYVAWGERIEALQVYETCRAVLAHELAVEPSPETLSLVQRIRSGSISRSRAEAPLFHVPPSPALLEGPLVGRDREFGALVERYHDACEGRPQVVLIEGEAGIGKTRLVHDFVEQARLNGARVLLARAFEMGGRLPYQPLIDALRPCLEMENAPDDLLADVWLTELTRLFPELRDRYPDLSDPVNDETTACAPLFEAISRLIHAWSQRTPLLLVLDDLQWADSASLDLLMYLTQYIARNAAPVLLVLTVRSESLRDGVSLAEWCNALARVLTLTSRVLSPLMASDIFTLLSALHSPEQSDHLRAANSSAIVERVGHWLFQKTAGLPFYLLEMLKLLIERHALMAQQLKEGTWRIDFADTIDERMQARDLIPATVRSLLITKLRSVGPPAQALLTAAAVLVQHSTFALLCQVANITEQEGLSALEAVLGQRMLVEERRERKQGTQIIYLFAHDTIREVVYSEASAARRQIAHQRALEALSPRLASWSELAYHALAADLDEPAFRYSIQAGDETMAVFAVQEALIFYEQAKAILLRTTNQNVLYDPEHRKLIQHLFMQLGQVYELLQQRRIAYEAYEELLSYAQERQDDYLCCLALNYLARVLAHEEDNLVQVRRLLQQARQAAERCGDAALLKETLWNEYQQGGAAWDQEVLAATTAQQRSQRVQEVQRWLVVAQSLTGFAYDNPQMTHWERAAVSAEQAIALYRQQGNVVMEGYSWNLLSAAQLQQDALQEAMTSGRKSLEILEQSDSIYGWNIIQAYVAYLLLLSGSYEEGWGLIHAAVARARRFGFITQTIIDLACQGDWFLLFGDEKQAEQVYHEALIFSEQLQDYGHIELLASRLSMLFALQENWQQALVFAERAQAVREEYAQTLFLAPSWYETETWLRAGKRVEAEHEITRMEKRIENSKRYRISLNRSCAVLARYDGNMEQAVAYLCAAITLAEELSLPGEHWQALAALADIYEQSGQTGRARKARSSAASIIQKLAARIKDQDLRQRFLASSPVQRMQAYLQ